MKPAHRPRTPPSRAPRRWPDARFALAPLVGLTLALGATLAAAQTSGPRESRPAASGAATAAGDAASKQAWERTHRASKIIGMDVVNRQGQKVGDVEDIVLDRNGNVAYAVVSTGGFLGVGDKLHAVPWRSLEANAVTGQFLLDVDKETLAKAPGFDNSSFPDVNDPKWSAENRKHFPVASSAASRSSTTGSESGTPRKKERNDARSTSGRSPTGNDIGPTTSTARRSGPAAGSGSSAASDAGSTSGTTAGSTATSDSRPGPTGATGGSAPGNAATNPPGGVGNATSATGGPTPGNGSTAGTTK